MSHRTRRAWRTAVVTVIAGLLAGFAVQFLAVPAAEAPRPATSVLHVYGPPVWLPIRVPANIGCANLACGPYRSHGYWALDFTGRQGDPVHAAGAGIAHIGGFSPGCPEQGSVDSRNGTWVWIDHGGGVVTRYHHLDSVLVADGEAVTPATRIGTMGHSGDNAPCRSNYLHFEVREGGVSGTRVDPGELRACTADGPQQLPARYGVSGWDDPALHPHPRLRTPQLDSDCIGADWLNSPGPPTVTAAVGSGQLDLRWTPVAGAEWAVIRIGDGTGGAARYLRVPAGAGGYRVTGLDDGTSYAVALAFGNAAGTSRWSDPPALVVPVGVPDAPPSPRYALWPDPSYVHYGWHRPDDHGRPVTAFEVGWRCIAGDDPWGGWSTRTQPPRDTYINLGELGAYDRCQVRVRATNDRGTGAWSVITTVPKPV